MFSKIIKEIVRGKMFFCSFILIYVPILWWAVLSGQPIAIEAAWIMTLFLGIVISIVGIVTSIEAWQSPFWSRAKAKLTKCFVKKHSDSEGSNYAPGVVYQFKVGDRHYYGSSYDFSDFFSSRIAANQKIESLKESVDQEGYINIYYKPNNPEINVIYPGFHLIHIIRIVVGAILIVISLLTLLGIIQW